MKYRDIFVCRRAANAEGGFRELDIVGRVRRTKNLPVKAIMVADVPDDICFQTVAVQHEEGVKIIRRTGDAQMAAIRA
nr:hypothetical protein [Octadecabacter antarcticus]